MRSRRVPRRVRILAVTALLFSACSSAASGPRERVLFLLGENFDPQEFWGPYSVLHTAGYSVDLAGAVKGMVLSPDIPVADGSIATTISLDEVKVSDYFALVVPGGPGGANVARFPRAGLIAREFNSTGKFIASVCHGARLLMPEGIFKQRRTTFVFTVADELADQWKAGDYGVYLDLPVVVDRNLISSRDPRDVPTWSGVLIDRFAEAGGLTVTRRNARVMIVLPGATDHPKWVLDRLSVFGVSPVVVSDVPTDAPSTGAGDAAPDMLVILDGPGIERLNLSRGLASMVDLFTEQNKTILVADAARRSLKAIDLQRATVLQPGNIAHVMKQIVARARPSQGALAKTIYPDTEEWTARYTAASQVPIQGAAWNPAIAYDAVLALWNGYDEDAATRMAGFLAAAGRRLLVVGPGEETIAGLNGGTAEVAATYADPIALTASAIVVAPGGLWPKLTDAQQAIQPPWVETDEPGRQRRLAWLTRQYTSGRLLVAFGFDSLHLGQQKLFKGMRFASTDQASVIWFGSTGAEYSPLDAMFSDKNLVTAKPLVGVDEAISLLQRSIKKDMRGVVGWSVPFAGINQFQSGATSSNDAQSTGHDQ
jgi:protease I